MKLSLDAFTQVTKIRKNIVNLQRGVDAIDKGADTGAIEKLFPSINQATLELEQVASELGLDVVGSVTFGALSEGELNLAMSTALPTGMQEDELRKWLVDKMAAQRKLAAYLDEQAVFLGGENATLAGWIERVKGGATQPTGGATVTPEAGLGTATTADQEFDAFFGANQ